MPQETGTFVGATAPPVPFIDIPADTSPQFSIAGTGVWAGASIYIEVDVDGNGFKLLPDVFVSAHRPRWSWNFEGPAQVRAILSRGKSATNVSFALNRVE